MLTILARRKREGCGPIDAETLALAIDAKTDHPDRLVPSRVSRLRAALAPFRLEIVNGRYVGYSLREVEPQVPALP
jgi:hypothetical protein